MDTLKQYFVQSEQLALKEGVYRHEGFVAGGRVRQYLQVRQKEGWLSTDEELRSMPKVSSSNPHYREWGMRAHSCERLIRYLSKRSPRKILDVGCGNGWMSKLLSVSLDSEVCGLDINKQELEQGARIFGSNPKLVFVLADLDDKILPHKTFDTIVVAAAIQYFDNLRALMEKLTPLLNAQGEIHIIDSPIYGSNESREKAMESSNDYFAKLGCPADYYHHHVIGALENYDMTIMYNPKRIAYRLKRKFFHAPLSPFPWVRVKAPI